MRANIPRGGQSFDVEESNILEYVLLLELCINNVALEECEKS